MKSNQTQAESEKEFFCSTEQIDAIVADCAAELVTRTEEGLGEFQPEMIEKFNRCEIGMDTVYPPNEFIFSIDGVPFMTRADIHTIGAKQKGGKTSLVTILISAALSGQWNRVKCQMEKLKVLYVDTEMKPIDTQELGKKVAKMSKTTTTDMSESVHLVNFRPLSPKEMEEGLRYFIIKYKPTLVIMDGIVDLCANFNDVEQSQKLVLEFLMKIAEEYQCAFVSILHTNKTDGYSELRGHLGAFLEQKGSTVIKCEKDDDANLVTVKFSTHRYAPIPEFHFSYDSEGTPIPADDQYDEIAAAKKLSDDAKKVAEKEAVYKQRSEVILNIINKNGGSIARKSLTQEAKNRIRRGESTIKGLLSAMMNESTPVIKQNGDMIKIINKPE